MCDRSGVGKSIHARVVPVPGNTSLELGLQILVDAPSDVVKKLCDRAAVIIENVGVKSFIEVISIEHCVIQLDSSVTGRSLRA